MWSRRFPSAPSRSSRVFYHDGNGIAFGKVAENAERVEFGWPLILSSALGVAYGGTGATTPEGGN